MAPRRNANAQTKVADDTRGPWWDWPEENLGDRCIRFITTYCRPPKGYGHGEPMKLAPFQEEWIRDVLADGVSASILSLPRGQGKSTLLAAIAVWATFDKSESGEPQVPIVATKVQQAITAVYGVAVKMVKAEPELVNRCRIYTAIGATRFVVDATGGECFPIANSVDGLQGLDPSLAIVDEIGFQPMETWDSLLLAGGKRSRSLVVGVGTPGLDRENALWQVRTRYLEGAQIPGFVYREYSAPEGCDHLDEDVWRAANPALAGGYYNIEILRTAVAMSPEASFRIFHLGQWVDGTDAWLGADGRKVWEGLKVKDHRLERGERIWVGLDVGLKRDSTACVIGQRMPDGRLYTTARIWRPKDGEVVDPTLVMEHLRELDRLYTIDSIAYDPRLFEVPALMLADEGLPMLEMPQSLERMTPAFGELYTAIMQGDICHDGDVAYTTQVLNGIPRFNERGFTLAKAKSRGKIDAAYALAMMYDRAQHPGPKVAPLVCDWA